MKCARFSVSPSRSLVTYLKDKVGYCSSFNEKFPLTNQPLHLHPNPPDESQRRAPVNHRTEGKTRPQVWHRQPWRKQFCVVIPVIASTFPKLNNLHVKRKTQENWYSAKAQQNRKIPPTQKQEWDEEEPQSEFLTSGSSGKMLSTSLLYRGLSAPQQPQTPEQGDKKRKQTGELFLHRRNETNIKSVSFLILSVKAPFLLCLYKLNK